MPFFLGDSSSLVSCNENVPWPLHSPDLMFCDFTMGLPENQGLHEQHSYPSRVESTNLKTNSNLYA